VTRPLVELQETIVKQVTFRQLFGKSAFQALGAENALVLGSNGNLWLEHAPFGSVPPDRSQVDGNVIAFSDIPGDLNTIAVLGSNNVLWLEHAPFGNIPPTRQEIDANVASFDPVDLNTIYVLGTDRNLWLEHGPFGTVPPSRQQVDGHVAQFEAIDANTVVVLGYDGKLWLEHGPFGTVPPQRQQIDGNVKAFSVIDSNTILVLGTNNALWLEHAPFGTVPPSREQIDGNVAAFDAVNASTVYVLGTNGVLWLEHGPFGAVPPPRQEVDANVAAFDSVDSNDVYVLGSNGALWLEHGPFGAVPPGRSEVDQLTVPEQLTFNWPFQTFGGDSTLAGFSATLTLNSSGNFTFSGSYQNHGTIPLFTAPAQDYQVAVVIVGANNVGFAVVQSGNNVPSAPQNGFNPTWSTSGTNAQIAQNWESLAFRNNAVAHVNNTVDLGAVLNTLETAIEDIGEIIGVAASVLSIVTL
jgi:hypothetical protein